eukprot:CAMPEP_0174301154 /NCGR_PEP_ID=MMETSP0809-20121228/58878_1 /TAXON_ID=73025 ORGANISM="Eutreptiella gymnastica-like, Strain CCMP1594" /NCGR_SAMPLE_ID=MMETSP0809 /ASSEMBLY_ACC=CAM_ASM_000658 /LENGTH=73 /DNA_ID=CAMNT_0015406845 /DNA_START=1607 /DNA_END=1826 /DNA_ORIENTATION=+
MAEAKPNTTGGMTHQSGPGQRNCGAAVSAAQQRSPSLQNEAVQMAPPETRAKRTGPDGMRALQSADDVGADDH